MKKIMLLPLAVMVLLAACSSAGDDGKSQSIAENSTATAGAEESAKDESSKAESSKTENSKAEEGKAEESKEDAESSVVVSHDVETGEDTEEPADAFNEADNEAESDPGVAGGQVYGDPRMLAESCIDKNVADLYALIGEPIFSEYAPSCLGPGDDGNLYYDSFIVYTYLEEDEETVIAVE